ncbi:hypothetical protein Tco_1393260 [Tanacetum coccineum]
MKRASKGYTGKTSMFSCNMIRAQYSDEGSTHPVESPTQSPVADKVASTGMDVKYGGATTTVTGLEVGQGSGNIDKTLTMPQDSPLQRVNTLKSDEGSAAYTKLIKKVKKLKNKVKSSQARRRARIIVSDDEDDLEDPFKQGRKIAEIDQDPAISLVQHDAENQGRHEHDMEFNFNLDAAKVLVLLRRLLVLLSQFLLLTKIKLHQEQERLGYEVAIRLQAKLKEEERQRIGRRLQEEEKEMYTEAEQARMLIELINQRKRLKNERVILKLAVGSSKRDANEEFDQESSKRQKISESSEPAKEPKDKEEELSQEELHKALGSTGRSSE